MTGAKYVGNKPQINTNYAANSFRGEVVHIDIVITHQRCRRYYEGEGTYQSCLYETTDRGIELLNGIRSWGQPCIKLSFVRPSNHSPTSSRHFSLTMWQVSGAEIFST